IDNAGSAILYDPSGSYVVNGHRSDSDDAFYDIDASLPDYLHFWYDYSVANGRTPVNPLVYTFDTTASEEAEFARRIHERNGGGFMGCASSVSSVLQGVGVFKTLHHAWFPTSLATQLNELMQAEARRRARR